jgi:hypothetical protein
MEAKEPMGEDKTHLNKVNPEELLKVKQLLVKMVEMRVNLNQVKDKYQI